MDIVDVFGVTLFKLGDINVRSNALLSTLGFI